MGDFKVKLKLKPCPFSIKNHLSTAIIDNEP